MRLIFIIGINMKIFIISDIHANSYALESALNRDSNYDYLIFVGDSVDYGPNPREVVDWLKNNADVLVMGNHDNAVAWNMDCGCGEKTHELSVYTREEISLKLLDEDQIKFLRELPLKRMIEVDGVKFYIVHGSPRNPLYDYVYPSLPNNELTRLLFEKTSVGDLRKINVDFLILGHTHIPMIKVVNETRIINPGSVGQPRDGIPRASFGILDTETKEFKIIRVKYSLEKAISDVKKLKLDKKFETWIISLLETADVDKALRLISS